MSDSHSKVVMGIDDNPAELGLLNAILMGAGYTFVASDAAECFNLVLGCAPRLILLDVQMPGIDGFDVCRRLRSMPEVRQVPIAFLTGYKRHEDVRQGMAAGGNDFIIKPFERAKLLARVDHWTSRRV
jgi:CheY-like chemotaxis protein